MNTAALEKLVAQSENIDNSVLKAAVIELAARETKKKQENYIVAIGVVKDATIRAVRQLREARKVEADAKKNVVKFAEAEEQFMKDGNVATYANAIYPTDAYSKADFIRRFQDLANG